MTLGPCLIVACSLLTNTLAYCAYVSMTQKKSFIKLISGGDEHHEHEILMGHHQLYKKAPGFDSSKFLE
jgi:hypothetical protein